MTGYSAYESGFSFLQKTVRLYEEPGVFLLIAACALILTIMFGMQSGRLFLAFPTIFFLMTVLNPFVLPVFIRNGSVSGEEYYRLLWLIPYGLIIAYGIISLAYRMKKGLPRNLVYAASLLLLAVTAVPSVKSMASVRPPADIFMTDEQLQMVCNYIIDETGYDDPMVAFDDAEFRLGAREYSAALKISHLFEDGRDTQDTASFSRSLTIWRPDFIVVRKESDAAGLLEGEGYPAVAYTDDYLVYVRK